MLGDHELQILIYGLVVATTGIVAGVVLAADPRRAANQWLAFFLLLVCGNFTLQVADAATSLAEDRGAIPPPEAVARHEKLQSVAFVLLAADPFALAYFASLFPRRSGLARSPLAAAALGSLVVAFLAIEVATARLSTPRLPIDPARVAFFAYMASAYAYAAFRLLRAYATEPSAIMARQLRVVAFGVLVAALPRIALVLDDLAPGLPAPFDPSARLNSWDLFQPANLAARLLLLWGLFLAANRVVAREARSPRAEESRSLLALVALAFAAFSLLWTLNRVVTFLGEEGLVDGALPATATLRTTTEYLTFAARWFVFSTAIVVGVVRYQVLAVREGAALAARLGLTAVAAFAIVGITATVAGAWAGAGAAALLFAGVAAAEAGVKRRGARSASATRMHARGLEVYRALLAASLADATGPRAQDLAAARRRLGVTDREHETLLAIARSEEPSAPPRDVVLGRYEVLRRLGAGGYATVHLARDLSTGSLVVLKHVAAMGSSSERHLESALRELEVARRVSHPNLVAIHDVSRVRDGAVVVMEYAEGGSLADALAAEGSLPPAEAARVVREALAGLAALHEAGVVHGDVKPANILLAGDGRVLLADFGAARDGRPDATLVRGSGGGAAGTILYMAPEQARGGRASRASDLYALAAVAQEILTGRPHLDARDRGPYEVLKLIVEGHHEPAASLSAPWRAFLARGLAVDPASRYPDAKSMMEAVPWT